MALILCCMQFLWADNSSVATASANLATGATAPADTQNWKVVDIGSINLEPLRKLASTLGTGATNLELLKVADAHYFIGKFEGDESHFEIAVKLSENVMALEPKNLAALLAWCASQGEIAQHKNPISALGYIRPIREKFLEIKEIQANYQGFVADRGLGRLYQLAPSFISIGSSEKAREHLKFALEGAPDNPGNQVYWADFLRSQGEFEEARLYARKALSNPNLLTSSLERHDWVRLANEVLSKIDPEIK